MPPAGAGGNGVSLVKDRRRLGSGRPFRRVPGLGIYYTQFPTAHAVGYYLSPFGLGALASHGVAPVLGACK
jgi:hypothetical protein